METDAERSMFLYRVAQVVVLAVLSPFWYPIAKAMWRELYAALLPEGGLFGRPPTEIELQRLQQQLGDYEDALISEPWARDMHRRPKGEQRRGATGGGARRGASRSGGAATSGRVSRGAAGTARSGGRGPGVSSRPGASRRTLR